MLIILSCNGNDFTFVSIIFPLPPVIIRFVKQVPESFGAYLFKAQYSSVSVPLLLPTYLDMKAK